MPAFPPRIHVLLARDAQRAVVIRRGPSKSVCTLAWDLATDQFTLGQWMRGRIYERRCDLSPDGRHMLYFAMNGRWTSPTLGSWTAISRSPYLKAVTLYPKGDCWNGGGLFLDNTTFWLNSGTLGHKPPMQTGPFKPSAKFVPKPHFGGECPGVYYHRLIRDGWKHINQTSTGQWSSPDIFEKKLPDNWVLRKLAHADLNHAPGQGCYHDEHQLLHPKSGQHLLFPDWEWADHASGRLLWAAHGVLFAAQLSDSGLQNQRTLHDFSAMSFEPIKAPY